MIDHVTRPATTLSRFPVTLKDDSQDPAHEADSFPDAARLCMQPESHLGPTSAHRDSRLILQLSLRPCFGSWDPTQDLEQEVSECRGGLLDFVSTVRL